MHVIKIAMRVLNAMKNTFLYFFHVSKNSSKCKLFRHSVSIFENLKKGKYLSRKIALLAYNVLCHDLSNNNVMN